MTPEQLKASILQRAMEGKLVPQDPTDEPASELLKRIKVEKEKLIADGKIKRDKKETELFRGADGKPYEKLADGTVKEFKKDIPTGWTIVYFPDICALENGSMKRGPFGSSITKSMFVPRGKNTYKVYEQGNAIRKTTEYGDYWLSEQDYLALKNFSVKPKDIIVSCAGTIGEIFQIPEDAPEGVINQALLKLTLNADIINFDYFKIMFASLVNLLKENSVGSAIKNLASIKFLKYDVPILLPPLAEQKRIVTKIERALEKVEAYAESYNKLQELDKSFPDKLKKSILQYAMQGKLVPQDPNDEPVEVLLEKIQTEKQKLYEEGKLKKKDLAEIVVTKGDDNSPYGKIPKSWRITPLSSITNIYTGNSINATEKKTYFSGVTGINYIATKDVNFDGSIDYDNGIKIPEDYLSKFKISPANSVLLCLEGGSAGRKIGLLEQEVCFGNKLCSLSFYTGENKFLYYFLQSPQFLSDFQDSKSGIIGGVSVKNLGVITIPMPPQKEQERIRSEVEQLFQKVNQL
ncbi:TPA: restriction endonuclease subunit S [Streptococcus suis]|nr:restriction endonuclease subunit S [Streptococcus suis]